MNERQTEQFPIEIFRKMCHGLFQTENMQKQRNNGSGDWMCKVSVEFVFKKFSHTTRARLSIRLNFRCGILTHALISAHKQTRINTNTRTQNLNLFYKHMKRHCYGIYNCQHFRWSQNNYSHSIIFNYLTTKLAQMPNMCLCIYLCLS